MHARCCRGVVGQKFKIFNNKPDRGKSVRKKIKIIQEFTSENVCFVLRITPFLFMQVINVLFINVNCNLFLGGKCVSKHIKSMSFIPKRSWKSLYVNINFLHVHNTCWIQSWSNAIFVQKCSSLTFRFPRLPITHTAVDVALFAQMRRRLAMFIHVCQLIIHLLRKIYFELCEKDILFCFRLLYPLKTCHQVHLENDNLGTFIECWGHPVSCKLSKSHGIMLWFSKLYLHSKNDKSLC